MFLEHSYKGELLIIFLLSALYFTFVCLLGGGVDSGLLETGLWVYSEDLRCPSMTNWHTMGLGAERLELCSTPASNEGPDL